MSPPPLARVSLQPPAGPPSVQGNMPLPPSASRAGGRHTPCLVTSEPRRRPVTRSVQLVDTGCGESASLLYIGACGVSNAVSIWYYGCVAHRTEKTYGELTGAAVHFSLFIWYWTCNDAAGKRGIIVVCYASLLYCLIFSQCH